MKNYWEDRNLDPDLPFPDKIVPFAVDGGGNLICFDYRRNINTDEPSIIFWHHEGESGTAEELSFVANSFDEFLDMLHDSRSEEMKKNNLIEEIESYGLGMLLAFDSDEVETMEWMWKNRNNDTELPFPNNIVPFSLDGGGNLICFDYRKNISTNEPEIVVWHHEGAGTEGELSFVANSFDEFLDMLHDNRTEEEKLDDEEYRKMWQKED
ncbi:unnamed protein product [Diamesa hyperborea]